MSRGLGNFEVNHQALKQAAQDLENQREAIWEVLRDTHRQMTEIADVMNSRAGQRLIERFNNLVSTYFDRYANSMAAHARYLDDAATRFEQTDEDLKVKAATAALRRFEEV